MDTSTTTTTNQLITTRPAALRFFLHRGGRRDACWGRLAAAFTGGRIWTACDDWIAVVWAIEWHRLPGRAAASAARLTVTTVTTHTVNAWIRGATPTVEAAGRLNDPLPSVPVPVDSRRRSKHQSRAGG